MLWISSICYLAENENCSINPLIALHCTAIHYFQWENWLSAWLCICIDNWYTWLKCILSVTQELLSAARDDNTRQINSYVQPYAVYELGCIFLAQSEVCLLNAMFILKLYKLALFDLNWMWSQAELCCFPHVGIQTVGKGRSLLLQAKVGYVHACYYSTLSMRDNCKMILFFFFFLSFRRITQAMNLRTGFMSGSIQPWHL